MHRWTERLLIDDSRPLTMPHFRLQKWRLHALAIASSALDTTAGSAITFGSFDSAGFLCWPLVILMDEVSPPVHFCLEGACQLSFLALHLAAPFSVVETV